MMLSKRKVCCAVLSIGIIVSSFAVPSYTSEIRNFVPQISAIDDYENPSYAIGELSEKSGESPEKIVEKYYNKKLNGSGDSEQSSFKIKGKSKNSMGRTVVSTVQTFKGYRIYGADQNYHINDSGVIECIAGSKVNDIENKVISTDFSVKYSEEDVLKAVEKHLGFAPVYEEEPKPEIILYPIDGKYHYVYEVEIESSSPYIMNSTYYIDAEDLSVVFVNNHIRCIDGDIPVLGSGIGQSGETKHLKMVYNTYDNMYYLRNTVDNFITFYGEDGWSLEPTIMAPFSHTDIHFDSYVDEDTYDLNIKYQKIAVDAHFNITKVINFFKNAPFYRNSQEDNNDADTVMSVLISTNSPRPYPGSPSPAPLAWGNKNYMAFNCIPGKDGKTIASCLDVITHEYCHGILRFEGLTGSETETNAIAEGVGDVFGVLAEYYLENDGLEDDWIMGEDILEEGEAWRRDASNPIIKTYSAFLNKEDRDEIDGAGLITLAASLMAKGGNNVTAIGYGKLARIFYNVIDDGYLTQETDLKQFANYAVQAARLLYGANSQACKSTKDAFIAVGLLDEGPKNLSYTYIGPNIYKLSWNGISGKRVGIFALNPGTKNAPTFVDTTNGSEYIINTLTGSFDYCVAYIDQSYDRISEFSNAVNIERLTKSAPTNLNMTNKNNLTVQLSWNGTTGDRFAIYRKISDTNDEFVKIAETTNKQITVETLNGKCDFVVAVVNSSGNRISPFSNVYSVSSYVSAPTYFNKVSSTSTKATFSWNGNSAIGNRYAIYRVRPGTLDTPVKIAETKHTTVEVNLASGTYDYQVAIVDLEGNRISNYSNIVTITK